VSRAVVIDTSAFVAALTESDGPAYLEAMEGAARTCASAATVFETRVVLTSLSNRKPRYPARVFEGFLEMVEQLRLEIVPFDRQQLVLAHEAYRRFGKGHHPAGLNLIDCAAYALARQRGEPLLFKGADFSQTGVEVAVVAG
jgi:ribonuclease VapC